MRWDGGPLEALHPPSYFYIVVEPHVRVFRYRGVLPPLLDCA
jgi:hypothetical protein